MLAYKAYKEVLQSQPDLSQEGVFRYWFLLDRPDITVAVFEVTGNLAPHRHPEGEHMAFFYEGEGHLLSGDDYREVGPLDWAMVKRGDAHNFYVPEGGRMTGIEVTAPRCLWDDSEFLVDGPELASIEAMREKFGQVGIASSKVVSDPHLVNQRVKK
jgi:quercetin dioxygenase-like cupin family protein